jgi:small subunit ribosomal protein S6
MYILDASLAEEAATQVSSTLAAAVVAAGGEIVSDELFGKRRLAFPIEGHSEGVYRLLYFRADGAIVPEVKHQMTLIEGIVRGMVVVATPKGIFTAKVKEPAPAPEVAPEAAPEVVAEAPAEGEAPVEAAAEPEAAVEAPAEVAAEAPAEPEA